jgi:NAD(P)-dependent dehydrogenase (short-subunit alcohol dehydrogenase family)
MSMLEGRVAIVSGGGRGIGRCHCLELARHGATVVVSDPGVGRGGEVEHDDPASDVVAEIIASGGRAKADSTSVTTFEGVRGLVERTVNEFGHLDIVVNNAGIVRDAMITSQREEDWDAVISVHLKGTFNLSKHACDYWRGVAKAGGSVSGRIINTTSGTGLFGNIGQASYGAAKAAIANLTLITAMEMQRYDVTANAIAPLAFTRMTESLPQMKGYAPKESWDRMDPDNAAPVVAWLASVESGWLSGAILRIDGNVVQRVQGWTIDATTTCVGRDDARLDAEELDTAMRKAYRALPGGIAGTGARSLGA